MVLEVCSGEYANCKIDKGCSFKGVERVSYCGKVIINNLVQILKFGREKLGNVKKITQILFNMIAWYCQI